jgi:hypothetical protein
MFVFENEQAAVPGWIWWPSKLSISVLWLVWDQIWQQPPAARVARRARDAEEANLGDVSVVGGEMGAVRTVGMADRQHRGHRLVREGADVKAEPDGCGGPTA